MIGQNQEVNSAHDFLKLVKLHALMKLTKGSSEVSIGVIDGPVDSQHPNFLGCRIRTARNSQVGSCRVADSAACMHGTGVVGVLGGKRGTPAPAICPECEIILRPVFAEESTKNGRYPNTTPEELSRALFETVDAGVKVINLSLGLSLSLTVYSGIEEACSYACKKGVILVASSGNQGNVGFVPLLHHQWVIPVVACDVYGRISAESNIGPTIGIRGLMAPGVDVPSTASGGEYTQLNGTSASAPFVTGAIALLWSLFPKASAAEIRYTLLTAAAINRSKIVPPLLNAEAAWSILKSNYQ